MNAAAPSTAWELPAAACAGALVGWIVTCVVDRLTAPGPTPAGARVGRRAAFPLVMALAAAALWWWEVSARGQLPVMAAAEAIPWLTLAWRWAGHLVMLGFLAAAAWIDLRDRVIPDAITLPGVIAGLAWAGLRPDSLPPVARAVPRSFAGPLFEADVLGLCGPLGGAELPAWLGSAPTVIGLGVASAMFLAWWLGCTAPAEPGASGLKGPDPRLPALAAGLVGIGAAWWRGGDHWTGLLSALAGLATGVALVWATRIGASRALGREALGFGDVTLMAVIGAWLGWQGALLTCCVGVFVGLVHGIAQFVLARDNELPFGPSLCLGAVVVTVLWRPLWSRLGPAFERPSEILVVAGAVIGLTALTLAMWRRRRVSAA